MDAGVAYFPTHDAVGPGELARLVEERGHRWLMFAEHTHIPASRETPAGGREGAPPLARKYWHTYDLFVAIGGVAGGDLVAPGRQRHLPRHRARPDHHRQGGREPRPPLGRAVRLRHRGRLEPRGDGQPRDRPAHAHAADARAGAGDEGDLDAGRGQFHGEFVDFERIWCYPKPLQRPHPPVLIGGDGPTVLDRVLEYGDGWMPNHRDADPGRIAELRDRAGRHVPVIVTGPPADAAALAPLAEAGVDRVLFWLPSTRRVLVEEALDRVERAMAELNGAV